MTLARKRCKPCEVGGKPLGKTKVKELMKKIPSWKLNRKGWLVKDYKFKDFVENVNFAHKVESLAELEDHHPNLYIHSWNKLRIETYTHAINGLSENDFIMAAKIDKL